MAALQLLGANHVFHSDGAREVLEVPLNLLLIVAAFGSFKPTEPIRLLPGLLQGLFVGLALISPLSPVLHLSG